MGSFFAELKRRNVYKVAVAYAVVAWLILQALSILLPAFEAPAWVLRVFIAAIAAGFPLALIFAWALRGENGRKYAGNMINRNFFRLGYLLCAAVSATAQSEPARPNIIVIVADDLGYGDVGFNGCPDIATPYLNSLATNGVRCTNGYATHVCCSPARAAILTGRYQQRFGHENQPGTEPSNPRLGLPSTELLLPQILKSAGYVSGAIGKWHLGAAPNLHPTQRGFDEFFGTIGGSAPYYNTALLRGTTPLVETEYLTDALTRESVSFINRHATEPFFLYLAYHAVHKPYDRPPERYMDRVANIADPDRRIYAGMLTALDDGVGQVLRTLESNGLSNNTLILFLSDNGGRNGAARNTPLRGYKFNVLEGGIRVPFVAQWKGRLPAGVTYDKPVSSLDIVATAAEAAGASLPTDRAYDGRDMVPYLAGEQATPPRALFWRWFGLGDDGPPGSLKTIRAVRDGPFKLVTERNSTSKPPALYNLLNDIGETTNLAVSRPADVASLKQQYQQWNNMLISPLWVDNSSVTPRVLAGDWNGYKKNDSNAPWRLTKIIAPGAQGTPDGHNWFTNTIRVATTGGDTTPGVHSFNLVGANSYTKQWGGVGINIDAVTMIPPFSGSALGPRNSITFENNYYYSFRIIDWGAQGGASLKVAVLKTSAAPVAVSRSAQTPTAPTAADAVVVGILTNKPKSPEEQIYVRWSTDFFITSHMKKATGSGMDYSATIPPQPAGVAVQYCVVVSTVDLSSVTTSGFIDPLVLTTTPNYKFTVD